MKASGAWGVVRASWFKGMDRKPSSKAAAEGSGAPRAGRPNKSAPVVSSAPRIAQRQPYPLGAMPGSPETFAEELEILNRCLLGLGEAAHFLVGAFLCGEQLASETRTVQTSAPGSPLARPTLQPSAKSERPFMASKVPPGPPATGGWNG